MKGSSHSLTGEQVAPWPVEGATESASGFLEGVLRQRFTDLLTKLTMILS